MGGTVVISGGRDRQDLHSHRIFILMGKSGNKQTHSLM